MNPAGETAEAGGEGNGRLRRKPPGRKTGLVFALIVVVAVLHFVTPTRPHLLHELHIFYQKLFYLPVIMAAAWFGTRGTVASAAAITAVLLVHILWQWADDPMRQSEQVGEIASVWVIAATASVLFGREKKALAEVAAANQETLAALASALDLREHKTALHSRRVREYALLLARRLGIREETAVVNIGMGALLHDVGKLGIPDRVLLKEGDLSAEERLEVVRHPELGAELIGEFGFLKGAREIVLSHHEKYDGTGYPRGIAGDAIPPGARIFAVVDAFDALTAGRPYQASCAYREAADRIVADRGTHFDPAVVEAFLGVPFRLWEEIARRNGVTLREA